MAAPPRRAGAAERRFEWMRDRYERGARLEPGARRGTVIGARCALFVAGAGARRRHRRRVHAEARRRRALGARDDAVHHLVRRVVARSCRRSAPILRSFPEVTVVASEHGRPDDGTNPDGLLQRRVLRRAQAVRRVARRIATRRSSSRPSNEKLSRVPRHQLQLHPAGRRRGGRGGDRPQELARREALRPRSRRARGTRQRDQARARTACAASTTSRSSRSSASRA